VKRTSCSVVLIVLLVSAFASADLKIKTKTTMMGHTTESTVYIKGARQRTEMSVGGPGGVVNLMQCDQKKMITITGNQCMIIPMGGSETSCPATPNIAAMMRGAAADTPRKGGVVTITRNATDTGERQDMFGYKARHIKSTMTMESSPDACNKSNMRMEIDGWYADVAGGFSCGDESYRAMACGGPGGRPGGCNDRFVMKGGGSAAPGFPLKQTVTMTSKEGTFTSTTEVMELANASLEAPMFDMPPGCRVMDMSAMMGGATPAKPEEPAPAAAPEPAAKPAEPAPVAAPALAPKAAGVVRIGVVKIKDMSGQSLPIENLRLNLMSEFARQQLEPIPLDTEASHQSVESEAREKQCDYVVYTVPTQLTEPGAGLPVTVLPKGVKLDPAKYQALSTITLYKVGKPLPEIKDLALAADAERFSVDAVMETFVQESDRVAKQIAEDAHPTKPVAKPAAKPATSKPKPK